MRKHLEQALKSALFVYTFHHNVAFCSWARGKSMLPTFNLYGDFLVCDALSPKLGLLKKGDVVVCVNPRDSGGLVIKRVIAMEGETIQYIRESRFFNEQVREAVVPAGHVWLQGDNLTDSRDSRSYGPVPKGLVKGRVFLKIWPYREFGVIRSTLEFAGEFINKDSEA